MFGATRDGRKRLLTNKVVRQTFECTATNIVMRRYLDGVHSSTTMRSDILSLLYVSQQARPGELHGYLSLNRPSVQVHRRQDIRLPGPRGVRTTTGTPRSTSRWRTARPRTLWPDDDIQPGASPRNRQQDQPERRRATNSRTGSAQLLQRISSYRYTF